MMASGVFALTGLPAVSADGTVVLLPIEEVVAGPLAPNLTLVEKGRDDHEIATLVVMTVAEATGETAAPKDVPGANRWLAEQHQAHDWRPLTAFPEPEPSEEGTPDHLAQGDVAVDWNEGHLTVTAGGKTVVDGKHDDWLAPSTQMCPDCEEQCSNPSKLAGVAGDLAHRLLVVTIGYHGTDSCWEPSPQVHVVSW
ncbi:MAG: hypothetical protein K8W52_44600 [Deltaproteobacteria bacterium]|nr:hypothetical protein [Deltaproteobacteria bacterium]